MAWAAMGAGGAPPLLALAGWLSHLSLDWDDPDVGAFHRALASRRRLILYDRPGLGLADRRPADYSLAGALDHASTVLDACGEPRIGVLGRGFSGPAAIALAVACPEQVSHLILFGTAARIVTPGDDGQGLSIPLASAIQRLALAEWGLAAQTMTALLLPEVTPSQAARYANYQRQCASSRVAAAILEAMPTLDATHLLTQVTVPTLVLHRRDDRAVPLSAAHYLAAEIPGARLVVLDGSENLPCFGDRRRILHEMDGFLAPVPRLLTTREVQVINGFAERLTNRAIASTLGISETTVARHAANIFAKLGVKNRTAAVVAARRLGQVPAPVSSLI